MIGKANELKRVEPTKQTTFGLVVPPCQYPLSISSLIYILLEQLTSVIDSWLGLSKFENGGCV